MPARSVNSFSNPSATLKCSSAGPQLRRSYPWSLLKHCVPMESAFIFYCYITTSLPFLMQCISLFRLISDFATCIRSLASFVRYLPIIKHIEKKNMALLSSHVDSCFKPASWPNSLHRRVLCALSLPLLLHHGCTKYTPICSTLTSCYIYVQICSRHCACLSIAEKYVNCTICHITLKMAFESGFFLLVDMETVRPTKNWN